MRRITYFQAGAVLADVGDGAHALTLPQDELTAVVRIAAILARNFGSRLPGEYEAVIEPGDDSGRVVVTEDDPRIVRARDLLIALGANREYTAVELAAVRQTLVGWQD
jgi:hypothetical protein